MVNETQRSIGRNIKIDSGIKERPEQERENIGVGLAIVTLASDGFTPLIWTINESTSKEQTEKKAGQLSIPAETAKPFETIPDNVLGALSEFCNDELLERPDVKVSVVTGYKDLIAVNGHFKANLVVMVYEGPLNTPINPVNEDEVEPNGWKSLSEIRQAENVRPLLADFAQREDAEKILINALFNPSNKRVDIRTLLPSRTSLLEFFLKREETSDIPLNI